MCNGDPRQVLQVVSSNGNRDSKVPLRPWSQTGRLTLSRGSITREQVGLTGWWSTGGLAPGLIKDRNHLLAPLHSWARQELWPEKLGHARTFLDVSVPPKQRSCCSEVFPQAWLPQASPLRFSPFPSQGALRAPGAQHLEWSQLGLTLTKYHERNCRAVELQDRRWMGGRRLRPGPARRREPQLPGMPAAFVRAPVKASRRGRSCLKKLLFTEIETSRRNTRASVTKAQLGISPGSRSSGRGRGWGVQEAEVQDWGCCQGPDLGPGGNCCFLAGKSISWLHHPPNSPQELDLAVWQRWAPWPPL